MTNKTLKLTMYNDPGHGWLRVDHQTILDMGIADIISAYSYMTSKFVYLEEDGDLSTFYAVCKSLDITLEIKDVYSNTRSTIRNYGHYKAEMLGGLNQGDVVINNKGVMYQVVTDNSSHYFVDHFGGNYPHYRLSKKTYSNFDKG